MDKEQKIHNMYENNLMYKPVSMEEIVNFKIIEIALKSSDYLRINDDVVKFVYTDYDHPFVLERNPGEKYVLNINPDWYLKNRKQVDNLISFIGKNTAYGKLTINDKILISSALIDGICANENLKVIDFGKFKDDGYVLSYDDFKKFKSSKISVVHSSSVDESLKDNFDPLIGYNQSKTLISNYRYTDLINPNYHLILTDSLKEEEIENFKYVDESIPITLSLNSLSFARQILEKLNKLGKKNKVVLRSKDKSEINKIISSLNIEYENLYVMNTNYEVQYKTYIRMEQILYQMVNSARDFSPFEKYIYAYNLTKRFKKYNENPKDNYSSRNLYSVLENEYMVCVGFSNMLGDLCEKLNIETSSLSAIIDISYDNVMSYDDLKKVVPVEKGYHARRYVHIKDEKYGIDGYYVSDPTWDNSIDKDYYNYMLITDSEANSARRYLMLDDESVDELFNVNSVHEFYEKFNFILNRKSKKMSSSIETISNYMIYELIDKINSLNKEYIKELKSKYPIINEPKDSWTGDLSNLLNDLANHIVTKVNKPVSGKTIMDGVHNLYRLTNLFGENTEEEFYKMLEDNKQRQSITFPKRYKNYGDENLLNYENNVNKFDIEYEHGIKSL